MILFTLSGGIELKKDIKTYLLYVLFIMFLISFAFNVSTVNTQRNTRNIIIRNISAELVTLHNYYLMLEGQLETSDEISRIHLVHRRDTLFNRLWFSVQEFERNINLVRGPGSGLVWWNAYSNASSSAFIIMDDSSVVDHIRLQRQILMEAVEAMASGNDLVFCEFHTLSLQPLQDLNFELSNYSIARILNAAARASYELWHPDPRF